jgi:hypothetical protein
MAHHEQLVLFDLTPYTSQQSAVDGDKALDIENVQPLRLIDFQQLEIDFYPQQTNEFFDDSLGLAA